MTTKKRILNSLALVIASFLFSIMNAAAGSATISLSGSNNTIVGNNIEVTVVVSNINGASSIQSFGGKLNFDSSYLEYVSYSKIVGFSSGTYKPGSNLVSLYAGDISERATGSTVSIIKFVFKTLKVGSTTISFTNPEVGGVDANNKSLVLASNNASKSVTIAPLPSSNANLSGITLSEGSINFNKDTLNYNVSVGSNTTSINVSATSEDNGAKISGTGSKALNYGTNKISIIVTAPSGAKKTYTLNITREDNRSKNTNLSKISLSTGTLSPRFNKNTLNYSLSVPFDISSIKVDATPEDNKSKVVISGGSTLRAGAVTTISIRVTAENGAAKTYYVRVTRGKDPNAPKSNNSFLSSINLTEGTLTPSFKKDVFEYSVSVENEVSTLEIIGTPEDALASIKLEGPEKLAIGDNEYKLIVTAEDGSTTKTYTLNITRKEGEIKDSDTSDDPKEEANNNLLKSLNLTNGKLNTNFKSDKFIYYYKKSKNFKLNAIPNIEDNKVTIVEHDNVITIIVGEDLNDAAIYTLIPKKSNLVLVICSIGAGSLVTFSSIVLTKTHLKKSKKKKTTKKKKNEA